MAKILGGAVATSRCPTIGFALDKQKQDDPVWSPIFEAYRPEATTGRMTPGGSRPREGDTGRARSDAAFTTCESIGEVAGVGSTKSATGT
jgi:hypothetical protein